MPLNLKVVCPCGWSGYRPASRVSIPCAKCGGTTVVARRPSVGQREATGRRNGRKSAKLRGGVRLTEVTVFAPAGMARRAE